MALKREITFSNQNKKGKSSRRRQNKLPVKRSINLAAVGEQHINMKIAVPAIILIIAGAVLLSKFAVVDRYTELNRANAEVAKLQNEIDDCYAVIESYGDMTDEYAHYTYEGMTSDELQLVDRTAVLQLLDDKILPITEIGAWKLSGNTLLLPLNSENLAAANQIVEVLDESPIVDYCTVSTATSATYSSRKSDTEWSDNVTVTITVYLTNAGEDGE